MLPGPPAIKFYGCNDPDFPGCKQPAGSKCRNKKGEEVPPHPKRWNLGQGYADAYNKAQESITNLLRQNKVLSENAADERETSERLEVLVAELRARIAELERPEPEPEPEPEVAVTKFGACPEKPGGTSLAAQAKVIAKWGRGAAIRVFCSGLGTAEARHPDAGIIHYSFKEFDRADVTDKAKVRETCKNMRAGDVVEVIHESDNDGLDAKGVADRIEHKNLFFDTVKEVRPDLLVAHTMTGWIFEPKSKLNPFVWAGKVKADVLGMDCDGIRPEKLPYTDYMDETRRMLEIVNDPANGYRFFAVPEFGCPRIPTLDPDGKIRAAYHDHYALEWRSSRKCLFVTLYEYDSSPNYSLTTELEKSGWRSHVLNSL